MCVVLGGDWTQGAAYCLHAHSACVVSSNDPINGCTFSKKIPTGLAGLSTLHQLGVVVPDIALLYRIFCVPVMAVHAVVPSSDVFWNVKPTHVSCAEQCSSASAIVTFAVPKSFPALMKPFSTA